MKILRYAAVFPIALLACSPSTPTSDNSGTESDPLGRGSLRVAQTVVETDLATDATVPALVNPWGLAFNPNGFAWISNQATGTATVHDSTGALLRTIDLPRTPGATEAPKPTGMVFNPVQSDFLGDTFIMVTENGTIIGWQQSTGAVVRVDKTQSEAVYKGAAIVQVSQTTTTGCVVDPERLLVANFRAATVDVFNASYEPVSVEGGFVDSSIPAGYAPFNIFVQGQRVFVSYALQNEEKEDDVAGRGNGFVNLFDTEGHFIQRLISRGSLNAPWGMAIAPSGFGQISGRLLVGNFGDGMINVYSLDRTTERGLAVREGVLGVTRSAPLVIDGLWSLVFGPDAGGFSSRSLYFTAGPGNETHGVFGKLDVKRLHVKKDAGDDSDAGDP